MPEMARNFERRRKVLLVLLAVPLAYAGIWFAMDLPFMAYCFRAPFLPGAAFYRRFSGYVGGPMEYVANLLSQAYHRPWLGALVFVLFLLACYAVARGVLRRFSRGSCAVPALVFALLMLMVVKRYAPLASVLPMLAGLAAAWLYMALRAARAWQSRAAQGAVVAVGLAAAFPVHYLLGGGFLYFAGLCALFELLATRRPLPGLAWLAAGAAVPYAVSFVCFEPDLLARYARGIQLQPCLPPVACLLAAFYAFVPAGALAGPFLDRLHRAPRVGLVAARATRAAGIGAAALLAAGLFALRLTQADWVYADFLVAHGRWAEALACLRRLPDDNDLVRFLALRALAHAGRLPWEMFHYPQSRSSDALLLRDRSWDLFPRVTDRRSDIGLDLGRVNEAERWAHESLAVQGESPDILERLALVNILNGRPAAAAIFLKALGRVPFQGGRASAYLERLRRDPSLGDDPLVRRIRPLMLRKDYVGYWTTDQILRQCLEVNPDHRMALEYLMAHCLLTSDMDGLGDLAVRFQDFYPVLPAHVEEALLVYRKVKGAWPPGIEAGRVAAETERRFDLFLATLARHDADDLAGWAALSPEFGETYWFFDVFGRTAAGPAAPEGGRP